MFFETFNKVASNVFEILECIIIILIVAEIVNVSIVVWLWFCGRHYDFSFFYEPKQPKGWNIASPKSSHKRCFATFFFIFKVKFHKWNYS
jgi:hypothetical protein